MMSTPKDIDSASALFNNPASPRKQVSTKHPAPFSLRLSEDERAELKRLACGRPMGEYIKDVIFEEKRRPGRTRGAVIRDYELFGKALGYLGQSRLSSNLNQLAKNANSGVIQLDPQARDTLFQASMAVIQMRDSFIKAMDLKPHSAKD